MAKERTSQLNDGDPALVTKDNDKNTVIALREIGEGKVSIKTLEDSAINRHRKHQTGSEELEEVQKKSTKMILTKYIRVKYQKVEQLYCPQKESEECQN